MTTDQETAATVAVVLAGFGGGLSPAIDDASTLFAHSEDDIAACFETIKTFVETRSGLYCETAAPVKHEDRIDTRSPREALFGEP